MTDSKLTDEQLREAFDTLLKANNSAKMAVEYQYKYDEWPLETIKAALSELAELRAKLSTQPKEV